MLAAAGFFFSIPLNPQIKTKLDSQRKKPTDNIHNKTKWQDISMNLKIQANKNKPIKAIKILYNISICAGTESEAVGHLKDLRVAEPLIASGCSWESDLPLLLFQSKLGNFRKMIQEMKEQHKKENSQVRYKNCKNNWK